MRVTLDKKALLALASDTRLEIMRNLQPMRRTVTQVADAMKIDKAGVHRHLQKLVDGELVTRHDDHGFVYYGLTWKGRDLLDPTENTKIVLLLGLSVLLLLGTTIVTLAALTPVPGPASADPFFGGFEQDYQLPGTRETATGPGDETGSEAAATLSLNPVLLLFGLLLAPGAAIALVIAASRIWRPKQRPAQSIEVVA